MDDRAHTRRVLRFPGGPGDGGPHDEGPPPACPPWPPVPGERVLAGGGGSPLLLEARLGVHCQRALRLRAALARLGTIDRAVVAEALAAFEGALDTLLKGLEVLRLRQPTPAELQRLADALPAAGAHLTHLRERIVLSLDADPQRLLLARERRATIHDRDVDDELGRRAERRFSRPDPTTTMLRLGAHHLPLPRSAALARRNQRQWRHEVDAQPRPPDTPLSALLTDLPGPWLAGLQLQIGLDPGASVEQTLDRLTQPRVLKGLVDTLPPPGRSALEDLLGEGGAMRFDTFTHRHGADDESAWFWAMDPPRTPVERLRRRGLLFVGTGEVGRHRQRVGFVPLELREPLARLLEESPASALALELEGL